MGETLQERIYNEWVKTGKTMKSLAQEFNVPIYIVAYHINKGLEKRKSASKETKR